MPRRLAAVLVMLAAMLPAACGGGDDNAPSARTGTPDATATPTSTPSSAPAVTHDDFVVELNRLCRRGNRLIEPANQELQTAIANGESERAAELVDETTERIAPIIERIRGLDPPEQDQAAFDRYLRAQNRTVGIRTRIGRALGAGDQEALGVLSEAAEREREKRLEAALDLGADECGA